MNSYYNDDVDAGYVKFTDNKKVRTEPISKNIYVDLDKNDKPVGVEVVGMKNNDRHDVVSKKTETSLFNTKSDKFK
ncbi:DUF2283 domain-containing protein [Candidatus Nitrosocosmicus hydrocola]|jgi:uncharacterized protein YuzE|uniref:DUF2283 domain-containing protein n=1 Tax=Candidatus Nitrosocosmicus hydrocola TaxID=1826872 RepID=UPI0011E5A355|nr:DUF2283 domain-containing protein [Candidatus Nitrosocosmicus hydrocola]